jgi:hypothetical protein
MKIFEITISISVLAAVLGSGCNTNLDTKKLITQTNPPLTRIQTSQSPTPHSSPSGAPLSSSKPGPSPTPSSSVAPVCSNATLSFSQLSGGLLAQWLDENSSPDVASPSLSATALTGLRLNQDEGLYLSVVTDSANNSAVGLIHCDSNAPSSPKIMDYAWMTSSGAVGIGGGDDPSVTEDSSSGSSCPDATSSALLKNIGKSLPPSLAGPLEVARVRSTATESLYLVAASGPNKQLVTALIHCDEKSPAQLDVLGVASSTSKGVTPITSP